jgi:glycogen debranching enzyme
MKTDLVRILDGNIFVLSDGSGDIVAKPGVPAGYFSFDTRFLSLWRLTVNGEQVSTLAMDDPSYFEVRFFLVPGAPTHYVDAKVSVIRERTVAGSFQERLTVLNHSGEWAELTVRVDAGADFSSLHMVGREHTPSGRLYRRVESGRLHLGYEREKYHRETRISTTEPAQVDEHGLTYHIRIEPHGQWITTLHVKGLVLRPDGQDIRERLSPRCRQRDTAGLQEDLRQWLDRAPQLSCDWKPLERTYRRALVDLAALRFSPLTLPTEPLPAAGLPWDATLTGRDPILTSLQVLPFMPDLAVNTLRMLGFDQGSVLDDFRDEEPGKILREFRYGEMVAFGERPQGPYFGAADSTPLYVILLDEYERWSGDAAVVREFEDEARAALHWIDEYGDIMGDGYVWYQRRNERTGLENQCWKETSNSISFRDGRLPGLPRATCELQGYAYDAKIRGARLAREFWGDPAYADRLERQAADLKERPRPRRRRPAGRRALLEHRPPAVERHRRGVPGTEDRRTPARPPPVLRLGRAHPRPGRGPLQPTRLPRRHRVAVRQLVHRLGPAALRVPPGGRPHRRGDHRRVPVLPVAPAGGLRRLRPRVDPAPRAVSRGEQPAGPVHRGAPAAGAHAARPRAVRR